MVDSLDELDFNRLSRLTVYKTAALSNKLTAREWAELFEAFQYSIETGWSQDARRLYSDLKGQVIEHLSLVWIGKEIVVKFRANNLQRVETAERWIRQNDKPPPQGK